MKEFISQNGGLVGFIVMCAIALNVLLSGISKALEVIMDKTKTETDNKIHAGLTKVLAILQKIVDWGSGNRPH